MWSRPDVEDDKELYQMTVFELDVSPYLNIALPAKGLPLEIQDDSVMIEANDNMAI